jgi:hypothetical protein
LYINDIADNTQSFSRLFADDTSLLYSSNNINEIEVIVNSDLSKIYNWSKEWLIDFNPKKTECIIFSTNQAANKPCIVFNNENVKFVENYKHLGVTFSHNCKWHCHIENILKRLTYLIIPFLLRLQLIYYYKLGKKTEWVIYN